MAKKEARKWKNKIVGHAEVDPETLIPNPENWRVHNKSQSQTLDAALSEVGWIQEVIVNKTSGRIVDGHLRCALALQNGEKKIPVVFVELTDEEEKKALATFDPLSAMATGSPEQYDKLVEGLTTESLWLRELFKNTTQQNQEQEEELEEELPQSANEVPGMELQPFEHYDYVVMLFRNDQDFSRACELLGLGRVAFEIPNSDKVKVGLGRVVDGAAALEKLCKL